MMARGTGRCGVIALLGLGSLLATAAQARDGQTPIGPSPGGRSQEGEAAIAQTIRPLMAHYAIPGMAVGVVVQGRAAVYDYGVAAKGGGPVTPDTLFEVGSVSKTFTATLAAYAAVTGRLSLSDSATRYLPALRGSHFDPVSVLNLATHTPGGLPLQFPDEVTNHEQLMAFFRGWQPAYAPGTYRTYANPGIGLLGMVAAKSMNGDFAALMKTRVIDGLGLKHTYLEVPAQQMTHYAQGYTASDTPVRMTPGVLAAEAYGIRTTAGDLLRFVEVNLGLLTVDGKLQRAIVATHTGYYRIGPMTQDLVWEQYPYPTALDDLLAGNSPKMINEANPASPLDPPMAPQEAVLINKTGSTNGFSAYVAFIPAEKAGVVLLANKSYPIEARVRAAYEILMRVAN